MFERIRSGIVAYVAAGVMAGAFAPSRAGAQDIVPSGPPIGAFIAVGLGWYSDVGQSFLAGGAFMTSFSFWLGPALPEFHVHGRRRERRGPDPVRDGVEWHGRRRQPAFPGRRGDRGGLKSYTEFDFSTGNLALGTRPDVHRVRPGGERRHSHGQRSRRHEPDGQRRGGGQYRGPTGESPHRPVGAQQPAARGDIRSGFLQHARHRNARTGDRDAGGDRNGRRVRYGPSASATPIERYAPSCRPIEARDHLIPRSFFGLRNRVSKITR